MNRSHNNSPSPLTKNSDTKVDDIIDRLNLNERKVTGASSEDKSDNTKKTVLSKFYNLFHTKSQKIEGNDKDKETDNSNKLYYKIERRKNEIFHDIEIDGSVKSLKELEKKLHSIGLDCKVEMKDYKIGTAPGYIVKSKKTNEKVYIKNITLQNLARGKTGNAMESYMSDILWGLGKAPKRNTAIDKNGHEIICSKDLNHSQTNPSRQYLEFDTSKARAAILERSTTLSVYNLHRKELDTLSKILGLNDIMNNANNYGIIKKYSDNKEVEKVQIVDFIPPTRQKLASRLVYSNSKRHEKLPIDLSQIKVNGTGVPLSKAERTRGISRGNFDMVKKYALTQNLAKLGLDEEEMDALQNINLKYTEIGLLEEELLMLNALNKRVPEIKAELQLMENENANTIKRALNKDLSPSMIENIKDILFANKYVNEIKTNEVPSR